MRYFIFYPPTNSRTLVDVGENVRIADVVELVKQRFGLKVHDSGPSETSIVLSHNGFDLKPNWCFSDLSIPSGSVIHCIYREEKAADIYVYCGFSKQTLKLFDSSITIETQIKTLRLKISDKLGLPLSTFCLETYDGTRRLYEEMKLINYDIKIHDRVYLKVWRGFDKFISACMKGFTSRYSPDELTRHYQAQVALHIAAFYGFIELANCALRQGARSDHPVGEPPSRQWSSETSIGLFPEMLRCPIHIAINRGHVIMVNLFVQQSIRCTQTRDPITGVLPYRLALSYSSAAKTKEEKLCYNSIYYFLYNKQYYSKIPLNANGEYITNLLSSTSNTNTVYRPHPNHINVSLPFYCRIISWCDRARHKVWKKFGGQYSTVIPTRRIYPEKGLLGYKVLIDGYNNTFEVPVEQLRPMRSSSTSRSDRLASLNGEEREKVMKMKKFMKDFSMDKWGRAKQLFITRRPTVSLLSQISVDVNNHPVVTAHENDDVKSFKRTFYRDNSSPTSVLRSSLASAAQRENSHISKHKTKQRSNTFRSIPPTPPTDEKTKQISSTISSPTSHIPLSLSALSNQLETAPDNNHKRTFSTGMSSVDAYMCSTARLDQEIEQRKAAKRQELFKEIEQSLQQQERKEEASTYSSDPYTNTLPASRSSMVDIDTRLALPNHRTNLGSGPIKSHHDLKIHQATLASYERYASASTRSTAISCLQEASHFKKKPWMKKVEMSQDMIKHKAQRRICRADGLNKKPTLLPLRVSATKTFHKSNTIKVV